MPLSNSTEATTPAASSASEADLTRTLVLD